MINLKCDQDQVDMLDVAYSKHKGLDDLHREMCSVYYRSIGLFHQTAPFKNPLVGKSLTKHSLAFPV